MFWVLAFAPVLKLAFIALWRAFTALFFAKMIFFFKNDAKKSSVMLGYNVFCYLCASLTLITEHFMKELIEKIQETYAAFAADANAQVEKGNKAAGTRARKASLQIEKMMKEFRKASLDASKN